MNLQEGFLKALQENEDDTATRLIYADWLDENNQPEEAARQRAWSEAKQWLVNFAAQCGTESYTGELITYDIIMSTTADYIQVLGYNYFSSLECGNADDLLSDPDTANKFWECYEIVTGTKVDDDLKHISGPFRCSC